MITFDVIYFSSGLTRIRNGMVYYLYEVRTASNAYVKKLINERTKEEEQAEVLYFIFFFFKNLPNFNFYPKFSVPEEELACFRCHCIAHYQLLKSATHQNSCWWKREKKINLTILK